MKSLVTLLHWSVVLTALVVLISCSKSDEGDSGPSQVLFINGIVNGNPCSVSVDDSLYLNLSAAFGLFTQYNEVQSGNHLFKIIDSKLLSAVATRSFNLSSGKNYSLMAVNTNLSPELIIIEDDLTIKDSTLAYIRLINLSPNSTQMELNITAGQNIANGLAFKSASSFMAISPGKHDFTIVGNSSQVAQISNFNLLPKKKYSILITGLIGQNPKAAYNIIVNK